MVELTAECDAITDGYNLRAKKFFDTGEDSVLCVDFNSVLSTNSLQFGLFLSSKLSANSKFVSTFCQRSCTVSTVASWCMASGVMIFCFRVVFFLLRRLRGSEFRPGIAGTGYARGISRTRCWLSALLLPLIFCQHV